MLKNRLVEKEKVATYAQVLYDGAFANGGQAAVLECRDQLEQIVKIIRGNADLAEALSNHAFSPEQRNTLALNTFASANSVLAQVLAVMAERLDIDLAGRVYNAYDQIAQASLNVTIVDVTTVCELDDHLRDVITKKVSDDLGTDVVLRERIDKSIIGGILLSANGKRIDASIRTQLENARVVLKKSADGGEC